jgi:hypothetical protein
MKLCEHIQPYYQQEIAAGNEAMSVTVKGWSNARYVVYLKWVFKYDYNITLNESTNPSYTTFVDPHYPESQDLFCHFCKIGLTAPQSNDQLYKYTPDSSIPNPNVIADKHNVTAPDDLNEGGMPTVIT